MLDKYRSRPGETRFQHILKGIKVMFLKLNTTARILTSLLLALAIPHQLQAAGPPPLNLLSNTNFVVLAETQITTTGGGSINGNVGLSGSGTGIHLTCAQVTGTIYAVDATGPLPCAVDDPTLVNQAVSDMLTSYTDAAGRTPVPTGSNLNPGAAYSSGYNIGGMTLPPGLYKFGIGQTAFINTDVTLNGGPSDVWIFQCGADLQVAAGVHIILAGGANANNIFWQVSSLAVLDTTSVFNGTILAGTSITMNTGSTMNGRALAQIVCSESISLGLTRDRVSVVYCSIHDSRRKKTDNRSARIDPQISIENGIASARYRRPPQNGEAVSRT
jgi:hypothetical protein